MKTIRNIAILLTFCLLHVASYGQYQNVKIKVGEPAPELSFPNPDGAVLSLKEINKGRFVLVDFWASWCGPCRRANPELVRLYHRFEKKKFAKAPKGFTVFSVSLDRKKEAWKAAIEKDGLVWPYHVSDLKSWQSEAAAAYGVAYIPQTFLLGPDGKVIGKYNSITEAMKELEKHLK